jgi:hypothetical protein
MGYFFCGAARPAGTRIRSAISARPDSRGGCPHVARLCVFPDFDRPEIAQVSYPAQSNHFRAADLQFQA